MNNGPLKLVVSGPVGAGKTTFIRSLSAIDVIETEEVSSEDIGKEMTTVAFDFGMLIEGDSVLHLYGTPGQDRFDFMWEVLCEGALGLILLVSGDKPGDYPHARRILEFVTSRIPIPFIVGVTRQDMRRVWEPRDVAGYFGLEPEQVVGINATERESALGAVTALLEALGDEEEPDEESRYEEPHFETPERGALEREEPVHEELQEKPGRETPPEPEYESPAPQSINERVAAHLAKGGKR